MIDNPHLHPIGDESGREDPALRAVLNLDDFESFAHEKLSEPAWHYYRGGAADEVTLKRNTAAFAKRSLRPRVLVDVSTIDTSTSFFGTQVAMPVGIAPNAIHGFAHPEGEVVTARAAAGAGVVMCVATMANRSLEDVAAAPPGPRWFQLYAHKDKAVTKRLVERAAEAGCEAIVLTVDLPVPGYREGEIRHPVELPEGQGLGNFAQMAISGAEMVDLLDGLVNDALTWDDLDELMRMTDLPVLVKGVLTGEDGALAAEHGVAGVVVSNHGGRQLDRSPASIDVLEEVVDAVGGRAEVYLDGGVRRGTDVLIALALGARGVFIGRPYLYALAAFGEAGVTHCLALMRAEIENAMALLGVTSVDQITRAHVL